MGDVQSKFQDDSDVTIAIPSVDPRDLIGPPVRGAIRSNRQVAPVSPPVVVTTNLQVGKAKKHSTLSPPHSFQSKQQRVENKILPLAESITKENSSEKKLLVFEELERVRTKQTVSSFTDRSSPESNSSDNMTKTSYRSESTSSDAGSLGSLGWRQRWCKVGREPGQIRYIKDLCVLRNGSIVATEPKNNRLQVFSKSGKSLFYLSPATDNLWSSKTFGNPLSLRKTQPTGVVETNVDNLIAVTNLNRIVYLEPISDGMLNEEVSLKGKTNLRGIATTRNSKIIVTEVGSEANVGMYETNGKFICEYKENFRKPCYVAYDPIYDLCAVSDSEQGLVFLYDASGNLLNKFGASKNPTGNQTSAGHLVYPSGICWSSHGRLLVADEVQKKVVAFDLRNLTAETLLTAEDGLNRPCALATDFRDSKNRIYVAEEFGNFGVNKYYLKMFEQRMTN